VTISKITSKENFGGLWTVNYLIGVDIGTTSTKAVMFDTLGAVMATANIGYPLFQEEPDMAEQDPVEIFEAVIGTIRQVVSKAQVPLHAVAGVSFSSAMHSLILLDDNHQPLGRMYTWADNRAEQVLPFFKKDKLGSKIYQRTGTPIHPMSPLLKIKWLQETQPALFEKTAFFVGIKEYILYRLFGKLVCDYSIASATGMFNLTDLCWDKLALKTLGITEKQLPKAVDPTYQLTGLKGTYVEVMGLYKEIPFIVGASDGVLSNLGVNAIEPGVLAVTIGTSGAVRTVVDRPMIDKKERLFCYALTKDKWVVGGAVNNGGIILRWLRDQLFASEKATAKQLQIDSYQLLTEMAEKVPAGSNGLIFHPFLGGERAPLWDANARGSYFGLTQKHGQSHFIRATLEGITYNLCTVMQAVEEVTGTAQAIQATGGFSRSTLWCQLLADIFENKVVIPKNFESSCLGAAVLGMVSLGLVPSLDVVSEMVGVTTAYEPNPENFAAYRALMPIYQNLTVALQGQYQAIADFQRKF
jgi:gluconokinase